MKTTKGSVLMLAVMLAYILPVVKANDTCSVCLQKMGRNTVNQETCCGHTFHATCLGRSLQKCSTCPLCRAKLVFHTCEYRYINHDMCIPFSSAALTLETSEQIAGELIVNGINIVSTLEEMPNTLQGEINELTEQEKTLFIAALYQFLSALNFNNSEETLLVLLIWVSDYFR